MKNSSSNGQKLTENAEVHLREKLRIEITGIIVFKRQRFKKVVHEKKVNNAEKVQCSKKTQVFVLLK